MSQRIGFVSTRFAGTDGVSLEARKWEQVLEAWGHTCFWFAGRSDRDPVRTRVVPQAFFQHPDNRWIDDRVFGRRRRAPEVTRRRIYLETMQAIYPQAERKVLIDAELEGLLPLLSLERKGGAQ